MIEALGGVAALAADHQQVQALVAADRLGDFADRQGRGGVAEGRGQVFGVRLAQVTGEDALDLAGGGFEAVAAVQLAAQGLELRLGGVDLVLRRVGGQGDGGLFEVDQHR